VQRERGKASKIVNHSETNECFVSIARSRAIAGKG
jgi:hypothetical protein